MSVCVLIPCNSNFGEILRHSKWNKSGGLKRVHPRVSPLFLPSRTSIIVHAVQVTVHPRPPHRPGRHRRNLLWMPLKGRQCKGSRGNCTPPRSSSYRMHGSYHLCRKETESHVSNYLRFPSREARGKLCGLSSRIRSWQSNPSINIYVVSVTKVHGCKSSGG